MKGPCGHPTHNDSASITSTPRKKSESANFPSRVGADTVGALPMPLLSDKSSEEREVRQMFGVGGRGTSTSIGCADSSAVK